jgi:uncharacterized cupredoxin-like copper-binding protein
MALLAALSTGHKLGLALTAVAWIAFALLVALVVPRFRPQFPGRRGLPFFLVVSFVFFLGMLSAVEVFGAEPKEKEAAKGGAKTAAPAGKTVAVTEVDFKIELPSSGYSAGTYTFDLANKGKVAHNLTVDGPGVKNAATPTIGAGKTAKLKVKLEKGRYELYCSVPGHKQLGMDTHVTVS